MKNKFFIPIDNLNRMAGRITEIQDLPLIYQHAYEEYIAMKRDEETVNSGEGGEK